jgi:hypothetical protein
MQLVDSTGHRALAFVVAAQRQGYEMTAQELDAYLAQPHRRPAIPGTPDRTTISTNLHRAIDDWTERNVHPLLQSIANALEIEAQQIPGQPGIPEQSAREWLVEIGWLRETAGRVRATQLGVALLAHLEQEDLEDEIPIGVVLDQGDRLASARVIQKLAEIGPCAVVDPYFSVDSLLQVLQSTQVEKVLTSTRAPSKISGLEAAMPAVESDRNLEIRKSDIFHDRFVIADSGSVWLLGTSFTGLGKRLSVMIEIKDSTVSQAIRSEFNSAWEAAEPVKSKAAEPEEASDQESKGKAEETPDAP